jgi:signal transduction histidine kinase
MAVGLSLALAVVLVATGGASSGSTFAWYVALPLVGTAAGILVVAACVRVAPASLFDSRPLGVAVTASYLPHLAGVVAAVSVGLAMLAMPAVRLQPWSQAAVDGISVSTATLLAAFAWAAGIRGLVAWLANRISALREREAAYSEESAARMEELESSQQRIVRAQESLRKATAEALHGPVQSRLLLASHRLAQASGTVPGDAAPAVQKARALIDGVIGMTCPQ